MSAYQQRIEYASSQMLSTRIEQLHLKGERCVQVFDAHKNGWGMLIEKISEVEKRGVT